MVCIFHPHYPTGKWLNLMVSPWPGLRLPPLFARPCSILGALMGPGNPLENRLAPEKSRLPKQIEQGKKKDRGLQPAGPIQGA